jgi:hypothetical protein
MFDDPSKSPLWPADSPAATAYVNLLQGVINRLAGASASCKTWCITLVSALLGLAGATHVPGIVTFALVPVVIFGFMDAMYLAQERAYRKLYARVVGLIRTNSFDRNQVFDAHAPREFFDFLLAISSWSILPVYLTLLVAYFVVAEEGWLAVLTAPVR